MILNKAATHNITGFTEYIEKFCFSKYINVCSINHSYVCNMLSKNCFFIVIVIWPYFSLLLQNFLFRSDDTKGSGLPLV